MKGAKVIIPDAILSDQNQFVFLRMNKGELL